MRVVHVFSNLASQMSVTVRALRDLGVEVRGIAAENRLADNRGLEVFPAAGTNRWRRPIRSSWRTWLLLRAGINGMKWADVIHRHGGGKLVPLDVDLRYCARLGKPHIVEFWGKDIFDSKIAVRDNPYMAEARRANPVLGTLRRGWYSSVENQKRFAEYRFACLATGAQMQQFIRPEIFRDYFRFRQRLLLSEYEPTYPDPLRKRPIVVHAPSNKVNKGTDFVLKAVSSLRPEHDFEFVLIDGLPFPEAQAAIKRCDIFLDQFLAGDHGLATLESMARGKPTFCYLQPSIMERHDSAIPIVNANPDNLAEKLREFIENGQLRHDVGRKSRAYVERHHDAHKLARELIGIYEDLLRKHSAGGRRGRC